MIADEVDHVQPRFSRRRPQAAAELLQKNNLRLGRPKHHHTVDQRQIDSLVEEVDHAQRREPPLLKGSEGGHAGIASIARKDRRRGDAPLHEPIAGKERVPPRTAEDERTIGRTRHPLPPQPLHPSAILQGNFQDAGVKPAVPPWNLLEVDVVLEPPIPKGHERPFGNPVTDRRLIGEDVVKERGYIDAVGPLRSGCQAECEHTLQPGQHPAIARGLGMMHFVDHAIVEGGSRSEGLKSLWPRELLNGGDDELAGEIG